MKHFMTFFTALALFCVQPNLPSMDLSPDTQSTSSSSSQQMPEIEVEPFEGDLLHATGNNFFGLALSGKLQVFSLLDPNEHTSFPLLRPPRG